MAQLIILCICMSDKANIPEQGIFSKGDTFAKHTPVTK